MNRIEEVKKIIDQAVQADLVDGKLGTEIYAKEICQLFPQPLDDKELREKVALALFEVFPVYSSWDICPKDNKEWYLNKADQIRALLQPKIEEAKREQLGKILPSPELLALAICFEMGKARGDKGLYEDYPAHFNEVMGKVGVGVREWLVNPPNGEYSWKP